MCQRPRLISVSSEGHCIIYYERGRFCNFSINGKLLAQMEVNDSTRVRLWELLLFLSVSCYLLLCLSINTFLSFLTQAHAVLSAVSCNLSVSSCSSLQAILLSSDGQNLVTGGDNGVVEVWQACDFKQLYIYPGCDAGIRAMDLSHDQR